MRPSATGPTWCTREPSWPRAPERRSSPRPAGSTELGRIRALVSEAQRRDAARAPARPAPAGSSRSPRWASCGGTVPRRVPARPPGARGLPDRRVAGRRRGARGPPTVATTTLALGMRGCSSAGCSCVASPRWRASDSTTVICVDKTGTVTENRMTVGRWHVAGRDHAQDGARARRARSRPGPGPHGGGALQRGHR